jgi:hypothetical protein
MDCIGISSGESEHSEVFVVWLMDFEQLLEHLVSGNPYAHIVNLVAYITY